MLVKLACIVFLLLFCGIITYVIHNCKYTGDYSKRLNILSIVILAIGYLMAASTIAFILKY